jgi:endoglucanase
MDKTEMLLQEITDAAGIPGYETDARKVMEKYLKGYADISYDKLGSIIGTKRGKSDSPRIMLAGHLDEIGFMVKGITTEGFIRFLPLGGVWTPAIMGQRVAIITSKGPVKGVIGARPGHIMKPEEKKKAVDIADMFIDVGTRDGYDIKRRLGIRLGDPIILDSKFTIMNNKQMYMAKALDDRSSCAVVIDVIRKFNRQTHPNTIFGVGTVQEEVGSRGAGAVARIVKPDVAIIVDVGIAEDPPPGNFKKEEKLGAGPAILIYDAGMIPNQKLRRLIIDTAEKNKIPFYLTSMPGGASDGKVIQVSGDGVPCIYMGVPIRYIHSYNSIMYRKDYDNTVRLISAVIKRLDRKIVESLTAC